MRIAVVVKQVPTFTEMALDTEGRLIRAGLPLELNPYCGRTVRARCEHDDGWIDAELDLPGLLSCAERLIEPCKVDPAGRGAVPAERIRRLSAADLGPGPWGQAGSPTSVGAVRVHEVNREGIVLHGPVD